MKNWDKIKEKKNSDGTPKYTERFRRMWEFYLNICMGLSRSQKSTVWQMAITKGDIPGGYHAVR
jgi:cyclopropane-fatty-acyl-phospholipid synthase